MIPEAAPWNLDEVAGHDMPLGHERIREEGLWVPCISQEVSWVNMLSVFPPLLQLSLVQQMHVLYRLESLAVGSELDLFFSTREHLLAPGYHRLDIVPEPVPIHFNFEGI